jgi:hypothetical protein
MHIRVSLHWGYFIVFWLFTLVYILCCGFHLFYNVWVCACVGFIVCGCFDNCVGLFVICVLVFIVFCMFVVCFYIVSFMYIYSYLFSL